MKRLAAIGVGVVVVAAGVHLFSREIHEPENVQPHDELKAAESEKETEAPAKLPVQVAPVEEPDTAEPGAQNPIPPKQRIRTAEEIGEKALEGLTFNQVTEADLRDMGVPENIKHGVLVEQVHPRSRAAWSGLRKGDVIFRAQRTQLTEAGKLNEAVRGRDHTLLRVIRDGEFIDVVLKPPMDP